MEINFVIFLSLADWDLNNNVPFVWNSLHIFEFSQKNKKISKLLMIILFFILHSKNLFIKMVTLKKSQITSDIVYTIITLNCNLCSKNFFLIFYILTLSKMLNKINFFQKNFILKFYIYKRRLAFFWVL